MRSRRCFYQVRVALNCRQESVGRLVTHAVGSDPLRSVALRGTVRLSRRELGIPSERDDLPAHDRRVK